MVEEGGYQFTFFFFFFCEVTLSSTARKRTSLVTLVLYKHNVTTPSHWSTNELWPLELRINGSHLAKMEKSIPHMSLPWNL